MAQKEFPGDGVVDMISQRCAAAGKFVRGGQAASAGWARFAPSARLTAAKKQLRLICKR